MQLSFLDRLLRLFDPVPPLGVPRDLHEASLRAADGMPSGASVWDWRPSGSWSSPSTGRASPEASGELAREHLDRGPGEAHRQERQKGAAQEGSKRRHAAVITAAAYKKLSSGSRDTAHAEPTPGISAVITSIGDDDLGP